MVSVLQIKVTDWIHVYKILHKQSNEVFNYCGDIKKGFFKYIILGQCYYLIKNDSVVGLLLLNRKSRTAAYLPIIGDGISLFRLIYTLANNLNLKGYTLSIKHKKLNPKLYMKYLPVDVSENYKHMYLNTKNSINRSFNIAENINVRNMVINKEESIRVMLQNNIFGNVAGRRQLTILEVYNEESSPTFLKDMCFILDIEGKPGGYGQILIVDDEYYLVNFGVTTENRNKGFGGYFLSQIINGCNLIGIEHLNLNVDNDNIPAVNLYKKLGFTELHNKFKIKFK
ncbi:MAG: family N-acetyltransferase [Clostridiales bacterium]|nr:family N-acetyltransferase [Clostridiales bacterium]